MNDADITKAAITLFAVAFGFVLSQVADWYKNKNRAFAKKQSIKKLIELELNKSEDLLEKYWCDLLKSHNHWFDTGGKLKSILVGSEAIKYSFPKLSQKAWDSNINEIASVYSSAEIEVIWQKYENNTQLSHLHAEIRYFENKCKEIGYQRESIGDLNTGGVIANFVGAMHFSEDAESACENFIKLMKVQLGKKYVLPEK